MSDHLDTKGHDHGGVRSEEDVVPTRRILAVGVLALVIFFLGSVAASAYLRVKQGEHPPLAIPPEIGQNKIGLVEQQLFELTDRGQRDRTKRLERLGSYGWVDRSAGVVHLPIDRAMELVAQGVRPPAPPPAADLPAAPVGPGPVTKPSGGQP